MLDWLHDHPRLTALLLGPVALAAGLAAMIGIILACEWFVSTTWGVTVIICAIPLAAAYWIGRMVIVDMVNQLWQEKQKKI